MDLKQLYEKGILSTRAYGICIKLGISNTKSLVQYESVHNGFLDVRNCGSGTNNELVRLCRSERISVLDNKSTLHSFQGPKLDLVNTYIQYNFDLLSKRSKNALKKHLKNKVDYFSILFEFLDNPIDIGSIPNVGEASKPEISSFLSGISEYTRVVQSAEVDVKNERIKLFLLQSHNISVSDSQIPESLFAVIQLVLKKTDQFSSRNKHVLFSTCNIDYTVEALDRETVAEHWGLSIERIRQLRIDLFAQLLNTIEEISGLNLEIKINDESDWIFVDKKLQSTINNESNTTFSAHFIALVFCILLKDRYFPASDIEDVLFSKTPQKHTRHKWKNIFLVSDTLHNKLNIKHFADLLFMTLEIKRKVAEQIHISKLLPELQHRTAKQHRSSVEKLMQVILKEEFDLRLDNDKTITLDANAYRPLKDYVYDILDKANRILHLNEIIARLKVEFPKRRLIPGSIRSALILHPDILAIGRQNIYGLKKWEVEKSDFKGGSIAHIIKEYLLSQEFPRTMKVIVPEVLKYRPESNYKSINAIPRLDQTGKFVIYNGDLFGLRSKQYRCGPNGEVLIERKKIPKKSWIERYDELYRFCQKMDRLPASSAKYNEENELYRWQYFQKKRSDLPEHKKLLLSQLYSKFGDVSSKIRVAKRLKKLETLEKFIIDSGRLPSQKENEKKLYYSYHSEKRKFQANEMPDELKARFEAILSLL